MTFAIEPIAVAIQKQTYHRKQKTPKQTTFRQKIKTIATKHLHPHVLIPVSKWLPHFDWRHDLFIDITAGFATAVLQIPHALAFSSLGAQSLVIGLNMAVFPMLPYILFGTSRHLVLSITVVLNAVIGGVIQNNLVDSELSPLEIGLAAAFLIGFWQFTIGALNLGCLLNLIPTIFTKALGQAMCFYIFVDQLRFFLGYQVQTYLGPLRFVYNLIEYGFHISNTNMLCVSICLMVFATVSFCNNFINPVITKKLKIAFSFELFIIILATVISYKFNLNDKFNVAIVGEVESSSVIFQVPPFEIMKQMAFNCFVIACVSGSVTRTMSKTIAEKSGNSINVNQELRAYGLSNIFGSFTSSLPISGSATPTNLLYRFGAKSQLASAVGAGFIVLFMLFCVNYLKHTPMCVFTGIILSVLPGVLKEIEDIPKVWKSDRLEVTIWASTFFSIVFIDVLYGLLIGFGVSVFVIVYRGLQTNVIEVSKDIISNKIINPQTETHVLKLSGSINFANANAVIGKINKTTCFSHDNKTGFSNFIILDFNGVSYVDAFGVAEILKCFNNLKSQNCDIVFVSCNVQVLDRFKRCGFFQIVPTMQLCENMQEAISNINTVVNGVYTVSL